MRYSLRLVLVLTVVVLGGCTEAPSTTSKVEAPHSTQAIPSMQGSTSQQSIGRGNIGTWIASPEDDVWSVNAISALSPSDVWAAGETYSAPSKVVLMHWDGAHWTTVTRLRTGYVASEANLYTIPSAITAIAPNNVWVVGKYRVGNNVQSTLIAHWDGTTFEMVKHPEKPGSDRGLNAVTGLGPDNIWAVGSDILHFDGQAWSEVSAQDQDASELQLGDSPNGMLLGMGAISANDAWAVGVMEHDALTIHWDGKNWKRVPNPGHAGSGEPPQWPMDTLTSLTAVASDDVWAAGYYSDGWMGNRAPFEAAIILHWDGKSWSEALWPDDLTKVADPRNNHLRVPEVVTGIVADSRDDIWVTGYDFGKSPPLLLHKHGDAWEINSCATVDVAYNIGSRILGLVKIPGGGVWLIGTLDPARDSLSPQRGFILNPYEGPCPTPTPFPPPPTLDTRPQPTPPPPVQSVEPLYVPTTEPPLPPPMPSSAAPLH